jgi:hypothetical protein
MKNRVRTGYAPFIVIAVGFVVFLVVMAVLVSQWTPTHGTTAYFNGSW